MRVEHGLLALACGFALAGSPGAALAHEAGAHAHPHHGRAERPASPKAKAKARHVKPRAGKGRGASVLPRRGAAQGDDHAHRHAAHAHPHAHGGAPHSSGDGHAHGARTEHIFGFTEGSDVHAAGETEAKLNTVARFAKRGGTYAAAETKAEIHTGVTDDFNVAFGFLGDARRVRSAPGLEDVPTRAGFSGASLEFRLRLLRREEAGFGMTVLVEPGVSRYDELTGGRASRLGSENALLFDRELIPGTLFGALNLTYDVERTRERGAPTTERGSSAGIGGALAYQLAPGLFAGGEIRYLRAYEGLALDRFAGEAVYLGPTLFAALTPRLGLTAAYSIQVAGREAVDRRGRAEAALGGETPDPIRPTALDLVNFERHQARLKLVYDF